jgi:hypothetical protein
MELVPLTPDYPLTAFDCGDEDLNKFLLDDAKPSQELRIANTFILEADDGRIAAYFCLLSDKVSKDEVIGTRTAGQRLMLHAAELWFRHPVTGVDMHLEVPKEW